MTRFERDIVNMFNNYFREEKYQGLAYRLKQHKFSSQILDVIVDNPFLGIECKSIKSNSSKKLYFSQHFSTVDGVNQVERITEFLDKSDRKGFLAVELKRGTGKKRRAFLIDWRFVNQVFESEKSGISANELVSSEYTVEIKRESQEYVLNDEMMRELGIKNRLRRS